MMTKVKRMALVLLRTLSLLAAAAALFGTLVERRTYALFIVIPGVLLAASPIILLDAVSAGTRYRPWRLPELCALGLSERCQVALSWVSTLVVVPVLLGGALTHWPAAPVWLSVAYERGVWLGPVLAVILLQAAAAFQTTLVLLAGGRAKRCPSGHEFTPFARACPVCRVKRGLELVHVRADT